MNPFQFIHMSDATLAQVLLGAAMLGALLVLMAALAAGRRKLLIDNLPTSKTSGVFIGLVELEGHAESDEPLRSTYANALCVWYRSTVRERWSSSSTDSDGRSSKDSGWKTIETILVERPFYLKDDRGTIRVVPKGAAVEPEVVLKRTCNRGDPLYGRCAASEISDSDGVREYIEEAVLVRGPLFVVGHARQRADIVAAEIAAHATAPMYLISTRPQKDVSHSLRWKFWGFGVLGFALAAAFLAWREHLLHPGIFSRFTFQRAGVLYLGAWLAGWTWMAFNSLIDLRSRVAQGWANIDVELKRRADLLPSIVKLVMALRDHEARVQGELAVLRAQSGATAPGKAGPDPAAAAGPLRAIAEAYPELKSNDAFLKMQKQLADTEDRIALARGYFNEIATFFNTRIQSFPDGLVAALCGIRRRALMQADGFERAPVQLTGLGSNKGVAAGPCPKCAADVRSIKGLRYCAFCGAHELDIADGHPHCRKCGAHMKGLPKAPALLAGQIHFCCHCGVQFAAA